MRLADAYRTLPTVLLLLTIAFFQTSAVRAQGDAAETAFLAQLAPAEANADLLGALHELHPEPALDGNQAVDLVGPAPLFRAAWTPEALRSRSLRGLSYEVRNDSEDHATFDVYLTWDRGTSAATATLLETFTLAPGSRDVRTVELGGLDSELRSGRYPGMLRLSLLSSQGGTHVLPAFYALPRHSDLFSDPDWPYELLAPEDLQRLTTQSLADDRDEEDGQGLRIVEWEPIGEGTAPVLASRDAAGAGISFTTCIRWQAQTNDSGHGEDRLSWADLPNRVVTAYGARIRITASDNSWQQTFNTSASSGCLTWTGELGETYDVRVYYYVNDQNANVIRYHNGGDSVFGNYPGSTYWYQVNDYQPSIFATTYVDVGNWSARATAMAAASMVSRYFPGLTAGKQIHMADDVSCQGSSAHFCTSNCNYSNDAYVRLETPACGNGREFRRAKFVVGHELGHARAINQQGRLEPNVVTTLDDETCANGGGYSVTSREWNSVSMREGFAHFVATWTFNNPTESDGVLRLFNTNYDVERNSPNATGGFIENNCDGAVDGHGTNIDALRLLWDWATPTSAANRASRADVMNTYEGMVDASPNHFQYFVRYYVDASFNLSTAKRDNLWAYACWNGLIPPDICNG